MTAEATSSQQQLPAPAGTGHHEARERPCQKTGGFHLPKKALVIAGFVEAVLLGIAFCVGRGVNVPGPLAFWQVAAQPLGVVTAGLLAIVAASVTFGAQRRTSDEATNSARLDREKDVRADALERCWTRFLWLVGAPTAGQGGPSVPVFPPDIEPVLVAALLEEANLLEDSALVLFIAQYSDDASTEWRMKRSAEMSAPGEDG